MPLLGAAAPARAANLRVVAPRATAGVPGAASIDFFSPSGFSLVAGKAVVLPRGQRSGGDRRLCLACRRSRRPPLRGVAAGGIASTLGGCDGAGGRRSVGRRGRAPRRAARGARRRRLGRRRPRGDEHRSRHRRELLLAGARVRRIAEAEHRCARRRRSPPRSPGRPQTSPRSTARSTARAPPPRPSPGAAALLAQMRPDLDGEGLAGLLAGYAQRGRAEPTAVGGGVLRLGASAVGELASTPTSIGFGIWEGSTGTRRASSRSATCRAAGSRCRRRRSSAATRRRLKFRIAPKDFIVARRACAPRQGDGARAAPQQTRGS